MRFHHIQEKEQRLPSVCHSRKLKRIDEFEKRKYFFKPMEEKMAKKVLVVDDDPDVITFNVSVLEENGYVPLIAKNGEEGLKKIKEEHPDLVILDVLMPKQSGIRLYRELKTDKTLENIRVIILSGIAKKTFLRSQKALTEFGGEQVPEPEIYLEKPVEPEELALAVKKILG
ncbi:MAG: response regulator [Pseudomonadota bacterium]